HGEAAFVGIGVLAEHDELGAGLRNGASRRQGAIAPVNRRVEVGGGGGGIVVFEGGDGPIEGAALSNGEINRKRGNDGARRPPRARDQDQHRSQGGDHRGTYPRHARGPHLRLSSIWVAPS